MNRGSWVKTDCKEGNERDGKKERDRAKRLKRGRGERMQTEKEIF